MLPIPVPGRSGGESGAGGRKHRNAHMKIDIRKLSDDLARDETITDYDFWKALGRIEDELHEVRRSNLPIPIRLIQHRKIIAVARRKRSGQ